MSAVRKYLPLDKVSGEKIGRNLHQSGGGKIQVKISRQIPRVETEPVIHHAGHTPLKYKEVIFRRVLTYTWTLMIWYELFQRNRKWSRWSGKKSGSLVSTLTFSRNGKIFQKWQKLPFCKRVYMTAKLSKMAKFQTANTSRMLASVQFINSETILDLLHAKTG